MHNTFGIDIIPGNDTERIRALERYKILGSPPEGAFDNVAKLATQIFKVPIADSIQLIINVDTLGDMARILGMVYYLIKFLIYLTGIIGPIIWVVNTQV